MDMQIDYNLLITYGAYAKKLKKGDFIFLEGEMPKYYHQVVKGSIRMFSTNDDGKEFIQGTFGEGQSFGEPPLFLDRPYPATAQATVDSAIIKISKKGLMCILNDDPQAAIDLLNTFAGRIFTKATSTQILLSSKPEDKIIQFFNTIKAKEKQSGPILINYTRQQIADYTGLRVETVIRTLLRMARDNKIKMTGHKVYY